MKPVLPWPEIKDLFPPFFFFKKFHYWSTVALHCCVSFCCTAQWLSYTNTHISPLSLEPPSHPTPIPPLEVISEHRAGLPVLYSNFPPATADHRFVFCVSVSPLLFTTSFLELSFPLALRYESSSLSPCLSGCSFSVCLAGLLSSAQQWKGGIPQGWVVGHSLSFRWSCPHLWL